MTMLQKVLILSIVLTISLSVT